MRCHHGVELSANGSAISNSPVAEAPAQDKRLIPAGNC
jgi:hypothetical protein